MRGTHPNPTDRDDDTCPHCGRSVGFMHLPEHCSPEQRALAYAPRERSSWLGWAVVVVVLSLACAGGYYVFQGPAPAAGRAEPKP